MGSKFDPQKERLLQHQWNMRAARRLVEEQGLVSYMNNTKWRELCEVFLVWPEGTPRHRISSLLAPEGYVSEWDREWYHHPYPYLDIRWLEIELPSHQIEAGLATCKQIGAAVEIAGAGLRVWGWVGANDHPRFVM